MVAILCIAVLYIFDASESTIKMLINRLVYSPFVEEGVYRVMVMGALLRFLNQHIAVILSTLAFVGLHYYFYDQFYWYHIGAGLALGYVFLWGKNLAINVAIHSLGNLVFILFG